MGHYLFQLGFAALALRSRRNRIVGGAGDEVKLDESREPLFAGLLSGGPSLLHSQRQPLPASVAQLTATRAGRNCDPFWCSCLGRSLRRPASLSSFDDPFAALWAKCLFFVLLSATSGPLAGEPVISRSADIARSIADRCFSSLEMTFSTSFTQSPSLSRESTPIQVYEASSLEISSYDMIQAQLPLHPSHNSWQS